MKFLVTGGAGFIGSNMVRFLLEKGNEVKVLDNLYLGKRENLPKEGNLDFIKGSVLNREKVDSAMDGCGKVIHFAAHSNSMMHTDHPAKAARVNICGFINVIESAIEHEIDHITYASTSSIYGSQEIPYSEEGINLVPLNRYACSKYSREIYSRLYSEVSDIDLVGLRYFSVYGPREKSKDGYANIISQFCWKMLKDERPVIWGDGEQTRDFIYVKDAVRATKKSLELEGNQVINVGTGKSTSFNEVVKLLNKAMDKEISPKYEDIKFDRYEFSHLADTEKMESVLDFQPKVSLEKGIKKVVSYYEKRI